MADQIQSDQTQQHFLDYPYGVSGSGTPNTTTADDHLRDLILQVLFTNPGERVNLPDFGAGIQRLIFAPNGDTLRSTVQFLVTTNLNRWLGDQIKVEQVNVTSDPGFEETVTLDIIFSLKATQERQQVQVQV